MAASNYQKSSPNEKTPPPRNEELRNHLESKQLSLSQKQIQYLENGISKGYTSLDQTKSIIDKLDKKMVQEGIKWNDKNPQELNKSASNMVDKNGDVKGFVVKREKKDSKENYYSVTAVNNGAYLKENKLENLGVSKSIESGKRLMEVAYVSKKLDEVKKEMRNELKQDKNLSDNSKNYQQQKEQTKSKAPEMSMSCQYLFMSLL